jgi:hypothetical protein
MDFRPLFHFCEVLGQIEPLSRPAQIVRRRSLTILAVVCSAVLVATTGYAVLIRSASSQSGQPAGPPVYNPYPPGILPPDLNAEIARVRAKIRTIFGRYLAQAVLPAPSDF